MPAAVGVADMQWRGAVVDADGSYPESDEWAPVDVPGRPEQFAGADAVAYRTTIDDPTTATSPHAVLELQGCYAETTVWVDGTEVAETDTYFTPLRVRLDDHLEAETEIRVVCARPSDGAGGIYETDWIPEADAVPGIWWDATVRTYQGSYVDRLHARPRLDGTDGWIDVRASVVATDDLDDRLTFSVRPVGNRRERGMMERAAVEAAAGERTSVEHRIEMRDPARWWPAELGGQNRYVVTAKLGGVEKTITTGFCTVEYGSDAVRVNGTETSVRGVNLLDATPEDVQRAAETNANLVRTHAHLPSPEVVQACEESGILLWADLPLTGDQRVTVDRGQQLATAVERHYGHAASLSAVGVQDDPVDPFKTPLGSGLLDRLRLRWRTWRAGYDADDPRAIAEALPDDLTAFPVIGPPGIDADATTLFPGWKYGSPADVEWLLDRSPEVDVVAEFGAGALASDRLQDLAGFDRRTHDAHTDGKNVDASQEYQARVCKRVAEGLRSGAVPTIAAFALRDTGDAGMGIFDADGEPKRAFEALRSAYEPVQAILSDPNANESDVVVHNALEKRFTGELRWESTADSGQTDVTIDTNAHASVTTIGIPDDGEVTLTLQTNDRTVENVYEYR